MPEALASAETLSVLLQQPDIADDPAQAQALDAALRMASGVVRGYCGWAITEETKSELRRGDGAAALLLPTLHLSAVEVTSVDTGGLLSDFDWYPSGILLRAGGWHGVLTIDYVSGYPATEVPDEIVAITCEIARRLYVNPAAVVSASINASHSRTYTQSSAGMAGGATLYPAEAAVLDRHRVQA